MRYVELRVVINNTVLYKLFFFQIGINSKTNDQKYSITKIHILVTYFSIITIGIIHYT